MATPEWETSIYSFGFLGYQRLRRKKGANRSIDRARHHESRALFFTLFFAFNCITIKTWYIRTMKHSCVSCEKMCGTRGLAASSAFATHGATNLRGQSRCATHFDGAVSMTGQRHFLPNEPNVLSLTNNM
jgi:hypothetical protein